MGETAQSRHLIGVPLEIQRADPRRPQSHRQAVDRPFFPVDQLRQSVPHAHRHRLHPLGVIVVQRLQYHREQSHRRGPRVLRGKGAVQKQLCFLRHPGLVHPLRLAAVGGQRPDSLRQTSRALRVRGQSVRERAAEITAYNLKIPALLEVRILPGVGDDQNAAVPEPQHILTQHTVKQEGILPPAHPDLIAIVEIPCGCGGDGVGREGGVEVFPAEQPLPLPDPAVQHQLTQLCGVLRADVQSPATLFHTHGTLFPQHVCNTHGGKKPLLQEIRQAPAGPAADDGGEQIGIQAVVEEARFRFLRCAEEPAHPVCLCQSLRLGEQQSGPHSQQVLHRQVLHPPPQAGDIVKNIRNPVCHCQRSTVNQQAHCQRDHALTGRKGVGRGQQGLGAKGGFAERLPPAQDQHSLHMQRRVGQLLQKFTDMAGCNPGLLRHGAGEGLGGMPQRQGAFIPRAGDKRLGGGSGVQQAAEQLKRPAGGGEIHSTAPLEFLDVVQVHDEHHHASHVHLHRHHGDGGVGTSRRHRQV